MVLGVAYVIRAVGEVHSDNIEASFPQHVNSFCRIGFRTCCGLARGMLHQLLGPTNRADDGSSAVVLGRDIFSVEIREPLDPGAAGVEMIQSICHGEEAD